MTLPSYYGFGFRVNDSYLEVVRIIGFFGCQRLVVLAGGPLLGGTLQYLSFQLSRLNPCTVLFVFSARVITNSSSDLMMT